LAGRKKRQQRSLGAKVLGHNKNTEGLGKKAEVEGNGIPLGGKETGGTEELAEIASRMEKGVPLKTSGKRIR